MVDGKRVQVFKKDLGPRKLPGHRRKARVARKAKMQKLARSHTAMVRRMCMPPSSAEDRRQLRNRRKSATRGA